VGKESAVEHPRSVGGWLRTSHERVIWRVMRIKKRGGGAVGASTRKAAQSSQDFLQGTPSRQKSSWGGTSKRKTSAQFELHSLIHPIESVTSTCVGHRHLGDREKLRGGVDGRIKGDCSLHRVDHPIFKGRDGNGRRILVHQTAPDEAPSDVTTPSPSPTDTKDNREDRQQEASAGEKDSV